MDSVGGLGEELRDTILLRRRDSMMGSQKLRVSNQIHVHMPSAGETPAGRKKYSTS